MFMVVRVKFQRMTRRGGGGTEAPTEYLSHDILVEYYSQDNMMMIMMRMTFQNNPEEDESDGDREDDYED